MSRQSRVSFSLSEHPNSLENSPSVSPERETAISSGSRSAVRTMSGIRAISTQDTPVSIQFTDVSSFMDELNKLVCENKQKAKDEEKELIWPPRRALHPGARMPRRICYGSVIRPAKLDRLSFSGRKLVSGAGSRFCIPRAYVLYFSMRTLSCFDLSSLPAREAKGRDPMPAQPKTVLLVDGHSLIHRAFHALPPLSVNGVYTNAVQGFFLMLFKAIADYRPSRAVRDVRHARAHLPPYDVRCSTRPGASPRPRS